MIYDSKWQHNLPSFFIRVELIACNNSTDKSANSHLTIVEIETEKSLGQADTLWSSDHISQIFEEI